MARAGKLKIYRTPIGFHDAYVAATSQKAALKAWGSDVNLFARGAAELVDDPELDRELFEKPGVVVKRLRGTEAEHLAALPPDQPRAPIPKPSRAAGKKSVKSLAKAKPKPKPTPRPSRAALDKAEKAFGKARWRHAEQCAELAAEEKRLARKRRDLQQRHDAEMARQERRCREARAAFDDAMRAWRDLT